jgi:hypothetical protein
MGKKYRQQKGAGELAANQFGPMTISGEFVIGVSHDHRKREDLDDVGKQPPEGVVFKKVKRYANQSGEGVKVRYRCSQESLPNVYLYFDGLGQHYGNDVTRKNLTVVFPSHCSLKKYPV